MLHIRYVLAREPLWVPLLTNKWFSGLFTGFPYPGKGIWSPVGFSCSYGAAGVVFDNAVEKPFTHYVGCCVFFATIGFSYCPGGCERNMKTFTRKVATTAIAAIVLTGVVGTPPAQAQELTSKEDCWLGVWANTGGPLFDRAAKAIDPATGYPYPTVEAVTEYVSAALDFYPAMSSYIGGTTIYCGGSV